MLSLRLGSAVLPGEGFCKLLSERGFWEAEVHYLMKASYSSHLKSHSWKAEAPS